jgi:SAM-dependent methyltransferase
MSDSPSWYLDLPVAEQKREIHQRWVRGAIGNQPRGVVLKTDLFEEAWGADRIFDDLFPDARLAVGMDLNGQTVLAAQQRNGSAFRSMVCDVRRLALRSASLDVVVSTSTLDHFESPEDIGESLDEIIRVLRPGGLLLLTLDNPRNPSYHVVRWMSRRGWTPYKLGATVSRPTLERMLIERGMRIQTAGYLIHNPRGISTALFLALRKVLGRFASVPIRTLLGAFAFLGTLPSRSFTGCFLAVGAVNGHAAANRQPDSSAGPGTDGPAGESAEPLSAG